MLVGRENIRCDNQTQVIKHQTNYLEGLAKVTSHAHTFSKGAGVVNQTTVITPTKILADKQM
jgi:hypothetical protein